jgi:hypothetical protein
VVVPGGPDSVYPACFADLDGHIYLRGHVTISPAPASGGGLLAALPRDSKGQCVCTPLPDPNTHDNNVIATTTALAYPRDNPNKPDVCIVRLLISLYVPVDVNLDLVVNATDDWLVQDSPYYNFLFSNTSTCPLVNGHHSCGRADVNNDGFVNQLDQTAIMQSANLATGGQPLPCGGVYASAFSCGSTRSAPLTPAIDISLDSIVYFDNDGQYGSETPLRKRDSGAAESILLQFEHMRRDVMTAVRSEFDAKVDSVRSEVRQVGSKVVQHEQVLRRSHPVSQREMFVGASVAAAVVVLSGFIVYFVAKRR